MRITRHKRLLREFMNLSLEEMADTMRDKFETMMADVEKVVKNQNKQAARRSRKVSTELHALFTAWRMKTVQELKGIRKRRTK